MLQQQSRLPSAVRLTSDLQRPRNPSHNGLEANVGQLQSVGPVSNPPGTIVEIAVYAIWKTYNLESAGSRMSKHLTQKLL